MSLSRSELLPVRPVRRTLPTSRTAQLLFLGLVLIAAALASPLRLGVVDGHSMEPTLHTKQPFLYRPFSPERDVLRRGELVVVRLGGQLCIKRLYALERDQYWIMSASASSTGIPGLLGVNDPIELWRRRFPQMWYHRGRVPEGRVYVVGDSSTHSLDCRQLGPVPIGDVIGRVTWPVVGAVPPGGSVSYWVDCPRVPGSSSRRRPTVMAAR